MHTHWRDGGLLPFVQEGNHSVGTHMSRPGLDLVKCKLKKILLGEVDEVQDDVNT